MPIQRIAVRTSTAERDRPVRVRLDGAEYRLRFRYSKVTDRWSLDLADAAGTPLVSGLRLVLGADLLLPYHHLPVPPGQLWAFDTASASTETAALFVEPGLEAFDERVLLLYRPVAEVV